MADLLSYAQREGKDPVARQTLLDFASWLHSTGRTGDLWPPERGRGQRSRDPSGRLHAVSLTCTTWAAG